MSDEVTHLLGQALTLLGTVAGITATLRGFSAVKHQASSANEHLRADVMRAISERTVSLDEYKIMVRERHAAENSAREKNIAQDLTIGALREEIRILGDRLMSQDLTIRTLIEINGVKKGGQ